MKNKEPYDKLAFWLWIIVTLVLAGFVAWASLKFVKYDNSIKYLDSKQVQQIVQKELQPVYTTIEGKQGKQGNDGKDGKDSMSTHTVIEKETTVITQEQIKGEKGDRGDNGRSMELAKDQSGNILYRLSGDRFWQPVTLLGEESE